MKKAICLGIMMVMIFSIAACDTKNLQSKIDELNKSSEQQAEKITELEEENKILTDQIAEWNEVNNMPSGIFYSIEEAYDRRLITREDLMHITYFMNGEVFEVKDGSTQMVKVEFEPQIAAPNTSDLDLQIVNNMRQVLYEKNQEGMENSLQWLKDNGYSNESITVMDTISITSFLGEYNNFFAVQITSSLWSYGLGVYEVNIAGIAWKQYSDPPVRIFAYQ